MGFRIFAVGTGGFGYSRNDVAYGDEWELSWVERQLLRRVGIGHRSPTGTGTGVALRAMSHIVQLDLLVTTITLLMANHGDGRLNLHVRHEHLLWPESGGFVHVPLTGSDPGRIARDLCRFLARNGMNKWGVIIEILDALTRFDAHYTGGSDYMINITLSD